MNQMSLWAVQHNAERRSMLSPMYAPNCSKHTYIQSRERENIARSNCRWIAQLLSYTNELSDSNPFPGPRKYFNFSRVMLYINAAYAVCGV